MPEVESKRPPLRVLVLGCGNRGTVYSNFALDFPERLKVVGVADPRKSKRELMAKNHEVSSERMFEDWSEAAALPRFADMVIIATPDIIHKDPAVAFSKLGYHILLEKPMAVTEADCEIIAKACDDNHVMLGVGHVLRYMPCNRKIKELIDSGAIGELVNINHTEPVGYFHFAHSYVRGNWRREDQSTFSLMAKSCHDMDLIRYWMDQLNGRGNRCVRLNSFGNLMHFRKEKQPVEAKGATRCLECPLKEECAYSAKKIYVDPVVNGGDTHFVELISDVVDVENVTQALTDGPYGRCVYHSDNDVVDHQVVSMSFEQGQSATFTMIAFSEALCNRSTKIYGSKGELTSPDGSTLHHFDFATGKTVTYDHRTWPTPKTRLSGHAYADYYLMENFVTAVEKNDPSLILTSPADALTSHKLVFQAEESRRRGGEMLVLADLNSKDKIKA